MPTPRRLPCAAVLLLWSQLAHAEGTPAADTSFLRLFTGLATDVVHLGTQDALWPLGLGGAATVAVRPGDDVTSRTLADAAGLRPWLRPGNALGHGTTQAAVAVGTWIVGRATRRDRVALTGSDLVRVQLLNGALTQALKAATRRDRPDGGTRSFPSGHTSATVATATVLAQHPGWKVGLPAYAVSVLVGASRIQDRRHYLSDVVFGATLGLTAGRAVTVGRGNARVAVTPFALPGGGGLRLALPSRPR